MLKLIDRLNAAFQNAYHNPHTSFYRDLYQGHVDGDIKIDSLSTWRSIPLLTKADLQEVPLMERLFTPVTDVDVLRTSSGTSGREPLITLRNFLWRYDALLERFKPTGILDMGAQNSYLAEIAFRDVFPDISYVTGSMRAVDAAARLASDLPINVLACWLFMIEATVPYLDRWGLREKIELVYTYGERVTPAQYSRLRELFPKAIIFTVYASSETHDSRLGYSIDEFDMNLGSIFSTSPDLYIELYDAETNSIIEESGREGEVVVSMLWTERNPSPLLRYRTGDLAMYVKYDEDPTKRKYVTRGRVNIDHVRIPGGRLEVFEVERAFLATAENMKPDFEIHYCLDEGGQKPRIELWVMPTGSFDDQSFIDRFMNELKISPERTYAEAVERGFLADIKLKKVSRMSREGKKRIRFILDNDK